MEKITLYKNKGEIFKCHFNIDGASTKETLVRLCLEFDNNINLYFNGNLKENGDCVIEIPILKNIDSNKCKLMVEAVADSLLFKVYEADVILKNSVEVTMERAEVKPTNIPKIQIEQVSSSWDKKSVITEQSNLKEYKPNPKPYISIEESKRTKKFASKFQDYIKDKN